MLMVEKIKTLMKEQNKKQKDLIAHLNEKQATVAKWTSTNEKIRNDIPNSILLRISTFLSVDIEYLLGSQEERVRSTVSIFSAVPFIGQSEKIRPRKYDSTSKELLPIKRSCYQDGMYAIESSTSEMHPLHKDGDILLCVHLDPIALKENMLVHYEFKDKIGVRRLKIDPEKSLIALTPLNIEEHEIIIILKNDRKNLKLSKIVGIMSFYND